MPSLSLSKSLFMCGAQCHKKLWLKKHRKDLIPPVSESLRAVFDQGALVGELARTYYPGGSLIPGGRKDIAAALVKTRQALAAGDSVIYEATFEHDQTIVRVDILRKARDGWELIEVKGSTKLKDEHLYDIGIQYYVLKGSGLNIRKACLMRINANYVRRGGVEVRELFAVEDVTAAVKKLQPEIERMLPAMRNVLLEKSEPAIDIGDHCGSPHACEFEDYCWRDIPDYSVFDLTRIRMKKAMELRNSGILTLEQIPENFGLSSAQSKQVEAAKTGKPVIDAAAIRKHLAKLKYPLYFFDFETVYPAVPLFNGTRPYQQVPFQFSLRVYPSSLSLEGRGQGEGVKHIEFLGDGLKDPRPELAAKLAESVGRKGSVVVYNAAFEDGVLKDLAQDYPKYAKKLTEIRNRLWDLIVPFRSGHYVHPKFCGSASIKDVLPALVPGMSYEEMEIGDGGAASQAYMDLMSGKLTPAQSKKIRLDLHQYCGQDTMGMVKLLKLLYAHQI